MLQQVSYRFIGKTSLVAYVQVYLERSEPMGRVYRKRDDGKGAGEQNKWLVETMATAPSKLRARWRQRKYESRAIFCTCPRVSVDRKRLTWGAYQQDRPSFLHLPPEALP